MHAHITKFISQHNNSNALRAGAGDSQAETYCWYNI
jgi:hypothetical protein